MNANVIYGVCNGDSGVVGYSSSASSYASDLAGYGAYSSGSGSNSSGGNNGSTSVTPDSVVVASSIIPPHYHQPDPRTPPLTPHDQQQLQQTGDGLSYTNLDANGYATAAAAAAAAAAYHGMQHTISSVGNSAYHQTDYSSVGQHHHHHQHHHQHGGMQQQQQMHHQAHHHHQQSHHHHHQIGMSGSGSTDGLNAVASIPTGTATPAGYGYPDVTQYGARTHAGHFTAAAAVAAGAYGGSGGQCQVNGMLSLAGLGGSPTAVGGNGVQQQQGSHHQQQSSSVNHSVQQQQQQQPPPSNVPTYKWMQVKRNVPKPGKRLNFFI